MVDSKKTARDYSQAYLRDRRPARPWNAWLADGIFVVGMVLLIALVFAFDLSRSARGAEPQRDRDARVALALADPGKTTEARDRTARAAIALTEAASAPIATAPPPKAKGKPLCTCGDDCKCKPGVCPACPSLKKDIAKVRESVVRVRCGNASGSGTVIWSEDGRSVVLTAAHVLAGDGELTVRGEGKTHKAQILGRDDGADLAALLVAADLPAARVSEADPDSGAEVLMVGPTSLWSQGTIGQRYRLGGADIWELSYDSDSGDSGGGVFFRGELCGVHCGRVGSTQSSAGVPYCTSAKPVRTFLGRVFRRDGAKLVPVAIVVVPAPSQRTIAPPIGSSCPGGNCPGGNCPAPTRRGLFR